MKKILMTKYGFVRWPEQDFLDDGSRFTCYKAGHRVRVSKTTYDGEAFISGTIIDGELPYEVYSALPHYRSLMNLNGISISSLEDSDLEKFYDDCLEYEQEYIDAENSVVFPSVVEITEQCEKIKAQAIIDADKAFDLFNKNFKLLIKNMSDYNWKRLKEYLKGLIDAVELYDSPEKITDYANKIYKTHWSFTFCKPTNSSLKESWKCSAVIEMIEAEKRKESESN